MLNTKFQSSYILEQDKNKIKRINVRKMERNLIINILFIYLLKISALSFSLFSHIYRISQKSVKTSKCQYKGTIIDKFIYASMFNCFMFL